MFVTVRQFATSCKFSFEIDLEPPPAPEYTPEDFSNDEDIDVPIVEGTFICCSYSCTVLLLIANLASDKEYFWMTVHVE